MVGDLVVRCAAKVNLCLEICHRRSDGYHDLKSLMTAISLWDELRIAPSSQFGAVDPLGYPLGEQNTIWRAATLIAEQTHRPLSFRIALQAKRIPEQSGLGGASSNGAAVLLALRFLWGLRWSWRRLVPIAARVGADVPFFLVPTGAAIAEGIGEQLTPVRLPLLWLVLAKPAQGMPTPQAFALWDASPVYCPTDPEALVAALWRRDIAAIRALVVNAFEKIISPHIPAVTELKQRLLAAGAVAAVMSGSGTTVVGLFFDQQQAKKALKVVQPLAAWCHLAHTVRRSICWHCGEEP